LENFSKGSAGGLFVILSKFLAGGTAETQEEAFKIAEDPFPS
jgi:hypothetical protein